MLEEAPKLRNFYCLSDYSDPSFLCRFLDLLCILGSLGLLLPFSPSLASYATNIINYEAFANGQFPVHLWLPPNITHIYVLIDKIISHRHSWLDYTYMNVSRSFCMLFYQYGVWEKFRRLELRAAVKKWNINEMLTCFRNKGIFCFGVFSLYFCHSEMG